ncbi:S-adenosyl-L-methionine-dependent methyltransferase [Trametes meyenii]|nr:S-adenosyl-L-methionine-dependent methyltransferase [Trametes meyenii]
MASRAAPSLLSQLSRVIGRESAQNELRWMRQALENPPRGIRPSAQTVEEMVARRVGGEPLQYILGSQPFGFLHLIVRPPVLIPRPETEDWALRLVDTLRPSPIRPLSVLDLCTGTGCIPLLLCKSLPPGSVNATAVDISEDAIRLTRENAALYGVAVSSSNSLPSERIAEGNESTFTPVLADLMRPDFVDRAGLRRPYDVITSNPPYISRADHNLLPASVKDFEDVRALLGDSNDCFSSTLPKAEREKGLTFYHRIAELIRDQGLLSSQGILALEVGDGQASDVVSIFERKTSLRNIDIWKDPWGKERVVVARTT